MPHKEIMPQNSPEVNRDHIFSSIFPMMVYLPTDTLGARKMEDALNKDIVEGSSNRRVEVHNAAPIKNSPSDK